MSFFIDSITSQQARQFRYLGKAIVGGGAVVMLEDVLAANLNFTTRDEYLAWKDAWKAAYAEISQDVRDQRQFNKMPKNRTRKIINENPRPAASQIAWVMLELRAASKKKAAQQREEARQPEYFPA
jgi:hypothetical protein